MALASLLQGVNVGQPLLAQPCGKPPRMMQCWDPRAWASFPKPATSTAACGAQSGLCPLHLDFPEGFQVTCEVAKRLLGLISSPTNRGTPSPNPVAFTQKLHIALRPLKPSWEVRGSPKEELPRCAFCAQHPLIKSLGKRQETSP